jgi:FHA domain
MEKNEFGEKRGVVKPFIIDLESTNGTHVNDEQIPAARYYELKLNDSELDPASAYAAIDALQLSNLGLRVGSLFCSTKVLPSEGCVAKPTSS